MLSGEGSYTIAYPMAILARQYGRSDLASLSLRQLEVRRERLVIGEDLYLRHHANGTRSFCNWSRAYAWYMLGLARTLRELKGWEGLGDSEHSRIQELERELARVSDVAISRQQPNGLWCVYVNEPVTGPETSGSSAIATALAIGVKLGVLGDRAAAAAKRTRDALDDFLTADGVLGGVSQNNKSGEELQRDGYRILSQMGTGLATQLYAALFAQ
ncbi:glycoside hydrolase family 88 protein [Paenibacillus roseipurpureus]|uniref:Glycoside hydrolase family 88 protein n=1 Tax=Paenibacillus roseopurpureus TaxID=2918901 RepID=A0AA96LR61_9BACL|nr:glycoside hydrolase family 88 protein [Paenibacillus sp. MBLB1832]WNR45758.1 glycoside hydrolase family 88 protein [Paenibacillus sp. MBLB1832]